MLSESLTRQLEDLGSEVRLKQKVSHILMEDGRAVGVRLAGGETIRAQRVVSNADPKRTFLKLLDAASLAASARLGIAELLSGGTTCILDMGWTRDSSTTDLGRGPSGARGSAAHQDRDGRALPAPRPLALRRRRARDPGRSP